MRIANTEQATAWDGEEGARWARNAVAYETCSGGYWQRFLAEVPVPRSARVLDVGCGAGRSTIDLARAAAEGSALGVDLSSQMLEVARRRAEDEGVHNVTFEQADAQVHPFEPAEVDLIVSRFGVMFFNEPVLAFTNMARAMRAGGSLAVLVWREIGLNAWASEVLKALAFGRTFPAPPPGAPGPFSLADPDRSRAMLEHAGFSHVTFDPIDEPFRAGHDLDSAFAFMRALGIVHGLTAGFEEQQLREADDALLAMLQKHETPDGVLLPAAAWLIRAER